MAFRELLFELMIFLPEGLIFLLVGEDEMFCCFECVVSDVALILQGVEILLVDYRESVGGIYLVLVLSEFIHIVIIVFTKNTLKSRHKLSDSVENRHT